MRKVFWDNPYQQELTTSVALVEGNRVLFYDTIAYSFAVGAHVNATAEVGFVTLKREHPGKGIERIEIRLVNADS